ncbi:TA system VapC family ribonuclease toxin [Xaviernesmea oryzae]|uniref:TA system VapC family ribonuclease toxin n=1 Tax=Xaviernesmea oryzae TaxID=464029 RepID=UPI0008B606B1|nr:TA system VapC family ribonuclease toxin [Xaviernesmea oryzae]SEM37753.1 toxin-antitoxin system PIN domain toxin [Xaviernesmea oryzae]
MTFLLDVNVLIALIDPGHVAHEDAHAWFAATGGLDWATCPITENGVIRIVGNPKYPNSPGTPGDVAAIVKTLRSLPGHRFWPDDVSLVDGPDLLPDRILTSTQVTDTFLLALARAHGGLLATFDRRLSVTAVRNGKAALHLIPSRTTGR